MAHSATGRTGEPVAPVHLTGAQKKAKIRSGRLTAKECCVKDKGTDPIAQGGDQAEGTIPPAEDVQHDDGLTPLYRTLWKIAARRATEKAATLQAQAEDTE